MFHKLYYFDFRDINNNKYFVEVWINVPIGNPIPAPMQIIGGKNPLTIKYTNDSLFNPVRGSGAELNFLSIADRMFTPLYTEDMMKYQLRVYKEIQVTPIYTQIIPFWFGYLDSENYSEDFSKLNNYVVSLTANDGFNLLDRMPYLTSEGNKLTGFSTQWETLLFCLDKLELPIEKIFVGLSTTIAGTSIPSNETIFHKVFINNLNWYDEDQEPETCRKVLESILSPYAAFIIQQDGNIYIVDNHSIASNTASFKAYNYQVGNTVYSNSVGGNYDLGDLSDGIIRKTGMNFEIESGINKQVVKYSPYNVDTLFNYSSKDDSFTTSGATHYFYEYGAPPAFSGDFDFIEQEYMNSQYFNKYNNGRFVVFKGIGLKNYGQTDQYLKVRPYENFASSHAGIEARKCLEISSVLPTIFNSDKHKVKLNFKIKATSSRYGDSSDGTLYKTFKEVKLHMNIIFTDINGNQYKYIYWIGENDNNATEYWTPNIEEIAVIQIRNKNEFINDKEITLKKFKEIRSNLPLEEQPFLIPITGMGLGTISVSIHDYVLRRMDDTYFTGGYLPDGLPFGSLLITEFDLTIVDNEGNELSKEDIEYTSKLNSKFSNSGEGITNLLGSNTTSYPLQRGNLMYKINDTQFQYLTGLTRNNLVDLPERLLLRSIKSNRGTANIRLSADIVTSKPLGYYTYDNYLANKKLVVLNNTLNLANNTSSVTLRELHIDDAIID